MALLLIGLNHRTTPLELREKLYLSAGKLYPVLSELKHQTATVQEIAIVSTCNRLEVYAIVRDVVAAEQEIIAYLCQYYGMSYEDLQPYLYIQQGQLAARHLLRVAAGLDSMILGETQILGQVSSALECATTVTTSGTFLHRLFEQALHTGKRARSETAISQQTTSISHAAALLVNNCLHLDNPYVLVIGAGEMAELAALTIVRDYGLTNVAVINRTFEHGQALAEKVNGVSYAWSHLWEQLARADVVITATGAPHLVLYAHDVQQVIARSEKPLVLVDIAVPRNIDPLVRDIEGVTLYDIDDLQQVVDDSLAHREACIPAVEAIIEEEAEKYWHWLNERNVVPVIKDLRREVQAVVEAELQDTLNKLGHLGEHEQEIVKRMAHRIMNKVLHAPTVSLREQAANGNGEDYAEVVRDLFALTADDDHTRLYA